MQNSVPLTLVKLAFPLCPTMTIPPVLIMLRTGTLQTGEDPLAPVIGPMMLPVLTMTVMLAAVNLGPTLLTLMTRLQGILVLVSSIPTRLGTCFVIGRTVN